MSKQRETEHERGTRVDMPLPDARPGNAAQRAPEFDHFDESHYRAIYRDAPYYSTGRDWNDYAPAYRYGHDAHVAHCGRRFEDVENQLAEQWNAAKDRSRLLWAEAQGAVRDAWQWLDDNTLGRAGPGSSG